jgi:hypothetical protein
MDSSGTEYGPVAGSCKHGNERTFGLQGSQGIYWLA